MGGILVLKGGAGSGKTVILEQLHTSCGGALVGVRQFLAALADRDPNAIEEAFLRPIEDAMQANDLVFVDDLHLVTDIVGKHGYSRRYLLEAALTALLAEARVLNKTLVFATTESAPWPIERRAFTWEIGAFRRGRL